MRARLRIAAIGVAISAILITPAIARDDLGIFAGWAAFRDTKASRCYAIAKPAPSKLRRDYKPYATVATWPKKDVRGQVHFRLSREMTPKTTIALVIDDKNFLLTGGGGDAWARDKTMDAAIVATMRSAKQMVIKARDTSGRGFSNTYQLTGAGKAMDAATKACARLGRRSLF